MEGAVKAKAKPQQIKATANLKAGTIRIEVIVAGSLDVIWLDREEAATFISELRVAYREIAAAVNSVPDEGQPAG
jgi:hypothetical protein